MSTFCEMWLSRWLFCSIAVSLCSRALILVTTAGRWFLAVSTNWTQPREDTHEKAVPDLFADTSSLSYSSGHERSGSRIPRRRVVSSSIPNRHTLASGRHCHRQRYASKRGGCLQRPDSKHGGDRSDQ